MTFKHGYTIIYDIKDRRKKMFDNTGTFTRYYFITISGKAGVGKNYIADKLKQTLDNSDLDATTVDIVAYADALRRELTLLEHEVREHNLSFIAAEHELPLSVMEEFTKIIGDKEIDFSNHKDPRYRHVLQWFGTDIMRSKDPDYWVKELCKYVVYNLNESYNYNAESNETKYATRIIIIPDARFSNEILALEHYMERYVGFSGVFEGVLAYSLKDSADHIKAKEAKRGSTPLTKEEQKHASETSLDNFTGFNKVFYRNESKNDGDKVIQAIKSDLYNLMFNDKFVAINEN